MNQTTCRPFSLLRSSTLFVRLTGTLMLVLLVASSTILCIAEESKSPPDAKTKSELVWKSGDRLPGSPTGFEAGKLTFESALFREPLEISSSWLQSFETNSARKKSDVSKERFAIQLIDGQIFLADIRSLDDTLLNVNSKRAGAFAINRTRVASIIDRAASQTLVSGAIDLDQWNAKRGEKQFWKPNDSGEVVATRDDIHLFFESELPESCLIDVEIAWNEKLDFALALQIPYAARSFGSVPRLESWDGSIVFSHDDDFEIVMVELDEDSKSLKLLIHWDQKSNTVVIHDEMGVELATAAINKTGVKAKPGIFMQNKNGDLRVKSLGIRSASAGFDPSTTSVQLKSEDAINATVQTYDGSIWTATKDGEQVEIPDNEFVAAFQFNPDTQLQPLTGDTLRFHDGEKVIGSLVGLDSDSITMQTNASTQPVTFKTDQLKQIQFNPATESTAEGDFNHVLISDVGKLHGRLESGSPTDENVLFWKVAGASESVPFANAILGGESVNAKVILEQENNNPEVANQWPDTLFLNNRDLLPVHFRSANEKEIVVDSFFENRVIPGSEIRAVEFAATVQSQKLNFSDPGWLTKGSARLSNDEFKLKKGGTIGHPDLMGRGGFEFELDWPSEKYGVLNVQFGRSLDKDGQLKAKDAPSFSVFLYAQQFFVSASNEARNPGQNIRQRGAKAVKIKVAIEKDRLIVYGNGKKCFSKKLTEGFGRCVSFRADDTFGQQISCELSNLELADGFLSGEYIDSERKELVLTIPRLKARNPPGQILCATNFDLARGDVVSINDDHVMFRTDNSVNRYPRSILGSIIWIDTESLLQSLVSESNEQEPMAEMEPVAETEPKAKSASEPAATAFESNRAKQQVAQVLMRGGRRVTLTLKRWDEDKLIGESNLLGNCEIPFEQIYEIRMGKFATEASDIPWSDWIAKLAPKPELDGASGAGEDDASIFGGDSPLIGKSPKLTLEMLDGKKVTLESLKGTIVVLDFWATWCGPCVKSLPGITQVIDNYPESSVQLIAVNQNESKQKIESFLESRKLDLNVATDDGDISEKFNVEAIPQTVIIDAAGKIQFVKIGASNDMEKKLRAAIDSLLDAQSDGD